MIEEFACLAAAAAVFVGAHFVLSATPVRRRLIAGLGRYGFLGLYSLIAIASLTWLVWSYRLAPYHYVWGTPEWARWLALGVLPLAFVLVLAGYLTPNPSAVMADSVLKRDNPAQGIIAITRHPVMIGIALWAAAHIIANGDVAGLILFGSQLILAVGGIAHLEARRAASGDGDWQRLKARTSIVPFVAIAGGRARFAFGLADWGFVLGGLVLYAVLLKIHGWAFGVYLIGRP